MTITIYASMREEAEKKLSALSRKSVRLSGQPITYSIGEDHPQKVNIEAFDPVGHCRYVANTYTVSACDVTIEDVRVQAPGWTLIAKLEHFDNGNLVTTYPFGERFPDEWRHCPPTCEHCHQKRDRKVTFMARNDDGTIHQVGSACLHDYTGIVPESVVSFASVLDWFDHAEAIGDNWDEEKCGHLESVRSAIAHAVDAIRKNGYVRSDMPNSTRGHVLQGLEFGRPSEEALAKADEIIAWALSDRLKPFECLAYDLRPVIEQGWCKRNHIGRLAYLPIDYDKWMKKHKPIEEQAARSNHVGTVGERITIKISAIEHVTSWETMYGTTHLYKITDTDGNVFVWFASGVFGEFRRINGHEHYIEFDTSNTTEIKATIKGHDERDGVKQTIITRCKRTA